MTRGRTLGRLALASLAFVLASGCGGTPTSPAQPATPPIDSGPRKPNDMPIITSLTPADPRVEANDEVAVTAGGQRPLHVRRHSG